MSEPENRGIGGVLSRASRQVGLDSHGAQIMRLGENALFRLPGQVVARIARAGQVAAATREVQVARWLADQGVGVVRALEGVENPVIVDGRAVTFWCELPSHRAGTPAEVAQVLRRLHDLPPPSEFSLAPVAPFVRVGERIDAALTLPEGDQTWLRRRLSELRDHDQVLPDGLPTRVIHGDAWGGNVVRTRDGQVVLLDLERCSLGPPEWDLTSTAMKHTSLRWITAGDYQSYCRHYGHDVTAWSGYARLRDIRELRMTTYLAEQASEHPELAAQAQRRVDCLRGRRGPRPWVWVPAP